MEDSTQSMVEAAKAVGEAHGIQAAILAALVLFRFTNPTGHGKHCLVSLSLLESTGLSLFYLALISTVLGVLF